MLNTRGTGRPESTSDSVGKVGGRYFVSRAKGILSCGQYSFFLCNAEHEGLCPLSQVPEDLQFMRSLSVLHLGGRNQISQLPSSLGNLTQLFELGIDNLKLENLHSAVMERGNKHIIHYLRGMQQK